MIALNNVKKGGSVERRKLGLSYSDLVRETLRQFTAIHDYRRYIGEGDPVPEGDIADAEGRSEGSPYDETLNQGENRPRGYHEGGNEDFEGVEG